GNQRAAIDPHGNQQEQAEQQQAQCHRTEGERQAAAAGQRRLDARRDQQRRVHFGTGTLASTSAITWSEVTPSRSASGRMISRWRSTGGATRFTSSGSR